MPTASATTTRQPNGDGKDNPLVTNANGDFGVQLDPVLGLLDAEVHYTTDGSTPTLKSPTFVPGESPSLQIRQDTTVKWVVVDSGNIVGPAGSKFFDIVESTNPAPRSTGVTAAPVSGAVDVVFKRLTDATVNQYRVQAYDDPGIVRIGTLVAIAQPTTGDTVTRRITGLTNGTKCKLAVAACYGTVYSNESALSAAVAPTAASAAVAGPDQTVLRGRPFTLDGGNSPEATSYSWTQIRPTTNNGGLPQDQRRADAHADCADAHHPDLRPLQFRLTPKGEWEYPGGTPAAIGGKIYLWSDYGFTATLTVTNEPHRSTRRARRARAAGPSACPRPPAP